MMLRQHFALYLGSRGVAAALNLVSVAVFARLAGPEIYGHYLLVAAYALIVFGFSAQWACAAFFATYSEHQAESHIASFVLLIGGVLTAFGLGAIGAGLFGSVEAPFLGALFAMATGLTLFEAAIDVARTRIESSRVAASVLLRAVCTLAFGITAITWFGTATALALAVAAANVLASLPCLLRFIPYVWRHASVVTAGHLFRYGWPLLLAFGVSALGQNIDRLLVGQWIGTRDLGPYGAISDLIKQTFFVVGESISLAFISLAKRSAGAGNHTEAAEVLEIAFTSLVAVAAFGAAFFLCFGPFIFNLVFGPEFAHLAASYFPILIVANVFIMLRAFYFSQVIYFSEIEPAGAVGVDRHSRRVGSALGIAHSGPGRRGRRLEPARRSSHRLPGLCHRGAPLLIGFPCRSAAVWPSSRWWEASSPSRPSSIGPFPRRLPLKRSTWRCSRPRRCSPCAASSCSACISVPSAHSPCANARAKRRA